MKRPALVRQVAYAAACALLFPFSGVTAFAQTVIATIPAQESPYPLTIAVNPLTQLVYIAGNGVEVVNQRTNTPVTTLNIGNNSESAIAINPVTRKLYVTDGPTPTENSTGLYIVDLNTNTIVGHFPISGVDSMTYSPVTNRVYTLDVFADVWVNDGTTGALIDKIATPPQIGSSQAFTITINPVTNVPLKGDESYFAAVDTLRNIIYVSDSAGQVDVLDGATNTETATITGTPLEFGEPGALSVDPLTRRVYLSNLGLNEVNVIDGATNTLTSTVIPVGTTPDFSAIDLLHGLLYVGNTAEFEPGSVSVSVISLK
jgi:YVTN family beta-propeller protein